MEKGRMTLTILERLAEAAATTNELLDIFLTDYHTSYRRARGMMTGMREPRSRGRDALDERQRYYNLVSRLKQQKFIEKTRGKKWYATARGMAWIEKLRVRMENAMPAAASYTSIPSFEWKIVIFDIPERERRKRRWLRAVLTRLGLERLQKSVWIGKAAFPESFLGDLRKFRLLPYIEIFAITKSGSLRHL